MYPRYFIFILALLLHAGAVSADAKSTSEPTVYQPLAAHYQETRRATGAHKETADWYFTRQDNQVESTRGGYAEIWQRDERGELTLTRVYHRDRKLIQYTPGELRTQGRQKDWSALNSIIDPRQLAALKQVGSVSYLGHPAKRYTGKLGGEKIEIVWLTREVLVARLVRTGRDASITLELKELRAEPDSRWPQASLAKSENYAYLDGADLGDMESDPFVQRVLGVDSGPGGHAHHTH